uniref:AP complex subunit sigma n=1 Tax=Percolomonas cosmopolitus TaxID=63605 RepID=A0A7S1KMP6_9EUKA|mmetsp:Transcript_195/g.663  ORF Transcript_195/g.663 Transcript_195/m.663 type:complete len:140 (+) Transcript_195:225-644(+)
MPISYILLVNKQGQTRLAQYTTFTPLKTRTTLEAEIIRRCLSRTEDQCAFLSYDGMKVIYRRYASLFFIVGVTPDENELSILEFIHCLVETFDQYFENVCELDVMFNLDRAYWIVEEMVQNGVVVEANKDNILEPLRLM